MRKTTRANKLDFNKLALQLRSILIVLPIIASSLLFLYIIIQYISFKPNDLAFVTRSSKIYDTNDTFLWEISKDNAVRNTPISFNDVPKNCINALIAIEDKTFWKNIGIDINGVGRLGISIFTGGSNGGGSTISQQVIKNAYQRIYNRNPVDKIREMTYAVKLNQYFTKEQILMMYLNNVYFGNLDYGIESASQDYFGKKTSELNLSECAYIVGIPQWPGVYNPYGQIEKGRTRQKEVLQAMVRDNYIGKSEMDGALTKTLAFNLNSIEVRAPHYIQYLQDKYGIMNDSPNTGTPGDINFDVPHKIYTYYNYALHRYAIDVAKQEVGRMQSKNVNNAAVIVLDSNSKLLTMVGSIDFFNDQINGKFNSSLGFRQPGSAIVPLIHISAYTNGIDPTKSETNNPYNLNVFINDKTELVTVKNFDNSQSTPISLENSLKNLLVIPSVQATQELGVTNLTDTLTSMHIEKSKDTKQWCTDVAALEGCEINLLDLTQAYNVIKRDGLYNDVNEIKEVVDDSDIIFSNDHFYSKSIDPKLTAAITKVNSVLNTTKQNGWVIIKGDTNNDKDTFVIAYNDQYTIGVWAGNTQGEAMNGITSNDVAMPIARSILQYLK